MNAYNYLAILLIMAAISPLTASAYSISQDGLNFIAEHEGIKYNLYKDPAGHCTIGIGHLVHTGNCDGTDPSEQEFLGGITENQAQELLRDDVAIAEQEVNSQVTVPLTQSQFDALVSFTFNLGGVRLATMLSDSGLNEGQYCSVPTEINKYHHSAGEDSPGLVTRRQEEGELFRSEISEPCINGEWALRYDWGCTDSPGQSIIYFNDDGTFSDGEWTQRGNTITWQYDQGQHAVYEGTIEGSHMEGTMSDDSSETGCWSADKRYYGTTENFA